MKINFKKTITFLLLITVFAVNRTNVFAQKYENVSIRCFSVYESDFFQSKRDSTFFLMSLLAISNGMTKEKEDEIEEDLLSFIEELRPKLKGSDKKQIDFIQSKIHAKYLKKYVEISPFANIFKTGEYNCVSATALFAYVLFQLNIPFEIRNKPTHVYLVAYPQTSMIVMESTMPVGGSFQFTERQKANAIQYLLNAKIITQEEVNQTDPNELLSKYVFSDEAVGVLDLAAFQYYNHALEYVSNNQTERAFEEINKAEVLSSNKLIKVLKFDIVVDLIKNKEVNNKDYYRYLREYAKLETRNNAVLYYYEVGISNQLFEQKNPSLADSTFNYITSYLSDTLLINEISRFYYYQLSYYYYLNSLFQKSFDKIQKAYSFNKQDVRTQSLFIDILIQVYYKKIASEDVLNQIEKLSVDYSFLKSQNLYQSFLLDMLAQHILTTYENDPNSEKPIKLLSKFEALLKNIEDYSTVNEELIGYVFAEYGAYYYRIRNYKKALEVLEIGIKYFPNHERIIARMDIVKKELKN